MAKEHKVKLVISTDAHRGSELEFMRFGVAQARRGWIGAGDIINTLPLRQLTKKLRVELFGKIRRVLQRLI